MSFLSVCAALVACIVLPGFAFAYGVSGARRPFDLFWQSILFAMLVFTPIVYPAAFAAGRPSLLSVSLPVAACAAGCLLFGRGVLKSGFWNLDRSSVRLAVVCAAWFVLTSRGAALSGDRACDSDVAYFFGMMRELGFETPAKNPELAQAFLTQSGGYWFWYACIQRLSGLGTAPTLWLVGSLLVVVLFASVHRVSFGIWRSEIAAIAGVLCLWVPTEPFWFRLSFGSDLGSRPYKSFARHMAIAWYNGPALVLMLLVLGCVAWLRRSPKDVKPIVVMMVLLVLFPFHHAMYFGVTLCGLLPYVVWAVASRRLPPAVLACFFAWLPFWAAGALWPDLMLRGDPRLTLPLDGFFRDLGTTLVRHALLLPFAALGLFRAKTEGAGILASLFGVLLLPGPWAGSWNRHWQWDPLSLVVALSAGRGIAALVERPVFWQAILSSLWIIPNVALMFMSGPFGAPGSTPGAGDLACRPPAGLIEAATWLRANTAEDAVVAALPASVEGRYVEVYGERRLVFGDALHLDMVDPAPLWRPVEADMHRLFEPRPVEETRSILDRHGVDVVVVSCDESRRCPRIAEALPVRFSAGAIRILAARPSVFSQ
jgi:hypothetical protein